MGFTDLPLLSQIKGRLSWLDERQRVIAQNVANSDTPGYVSRDLNRPTDFARALAAMGIEIIGRIGIEVREAL